MSTYYDRFYWRRCSWTDPDVTDKSIKKVLSQCMNIPKGKLPYNIEEIFEKTRSFPIPFPLESIRLGTLKERIPMNKLKNNIISTYPIVHERALLQMAKFLVHKRKHGTNIEKACYKSMSIPQFVNRLLKRRAVSFLGAQDWYYLLSGEKGTNGWDTIGTSEEKPPLILENCLSYDELKLSAMLYVSGYSECINNGARNNNGIVDSNAEGDAIVIGLIGTRFLRHNKMDFDDIIIVEDENSSYLRTEEQTTGGFFSMFFQSEDMRKKIAKQQLTQIWEEFYENPTIDYYDLPSNHIYVIPSSRDDVSAIYRFLPGTDDKKVFNNNVYYKRITILAETLLMEAEYRAMESGKNAFINVVGCGLGTWLLTAHQSNIYVIIFMERIDTFLNKGLLDHITDINFAYIETTGEVEAMFPNTIRENDGNPEIKQTFFESGTHPKGGINVQMQDREPSSKLTGEHEGKLLVITYPADSNSLPGNEFWQESFNTSSGAAAACSTQISELHNAHINPAVDGNNLRVAGKDGVKTLSEYCTTLTKS